MDISVDQPIVSFKIQSSWSNKLLSIFSRFSFSNIHSKNWLDSCETNETHFLTLKPLIDIKLWSKKLHSENDLAVLTLGGGGRLGVLCLTKDYMKTKNIPKSNKIMFGFSEYFESIKHIQAKYIKSNDRISYLKNIQENLNYVKDKFRGIDQTYFLWNCA